MNKKIKFEENKNPKFELVLQVRDHLGNPTGKTKSFTTDDCEQLDGFWHRNVGTNKTKKKEVKEKKEKK